MKKEIHPKYYENIQGKCACGKVFKINSTAQEINVEICGHCHPFYTGSQQLIDTAGRVERFKARKAKAKTPTKVRKNTKTQK